MQLPCRATCTATCFLWTHHMRRHIVASTIRAAAAPRSSPVSRRHKGPDAHRITPHLGSPPAVQALPRVQPRPRARAAQADMRCVVGSGPGASAAPRGEMRVAAPPGPGLGRAPRGLHLSWVAGAAAVVSSGGDWQACMTASVPWNARCSEAAREAGSQITVHAPQVLPARSSHGQVPRLISSGFDAEG